MINRGTMSRGILCPLEFFHRHAYSGREWMPDEAGGFVVAISNVRSSGLYKYLRKYNYT